MTTDTRDVAADRRTGYTLPQAYYVADEFFQRDLERVFATNWLFVGSSSEVPRPGDVAAWSMGRDSVLLTRDDEGVVRAHHNVCRHRGCRLWPEGSGSARVVVCPYHQWTYGLDGALRAAPHMGPDADRHELSLRPVHLRNLGGLLFVCFSDAAPPFDPAVDAVEPQLRLHDLEQARVAARQHYTVAANWKILVENNRECYHCRVNHPEFCLSNYDFGIAGDSRTNRQYEAAVADHHRRWVEQGLAPQEVSFADDGWFRVARLPLRDGFVTESLSGSLIAPLLGRLPSSDVGSLRLVTLPNSWTHVDADYAATTRLTPVGPERTDVDITFLVRADAVEGRDYTVAELTAVLGATSEQDWELCELNAAGIRSRGYLPGPLSPVTEGSVSTFHDWYLRCLEGDS
ncbi:MAG: aromatic ring-hydroxylating dioxygenase subunit alpha [Sporichthyaceae bacterium]|nr:aromatic ring-hydroxylating dioxygenase subunit alpha [Sporichthyaceae bacterium]